MNLVPRLEFKNIKDLPVKITDWVGSISSIIIHSLFFIGIFILYFFEFPVDSILLVLTTIVSLEAIYLSIFIQMTVNRNTQSLQVVEENIDEIQEDVGEMERDIDEIQEDLDKEEIEKETQVQKNLGSIEVRLQAIINEIETIKNQSKDKLQYKE